MHAIDGNNKFEKQIRETRAKSSILKIIAVSYYINKKISMDFELAVKLVKEVLKIEGFGVLSETDIQQKMKEKLGIDF